MSISYSPITFWANKVYEEKKKLLEENRITVWRDHDHMHAHKPDSIFTGVIKYLGWENYQIRTMKDKKFCYLFHFPETTVRRFGEQLREKFKLNGLRYIGRPEDKISKVAIVGHLYPNAFGEDNLREDAYYEYALDIMQLLEEGVDAIIPGEIIEWTVLSYICDAVKLGTNKAVFQVGHFKIEDLGMRYAADWISELTEYKVPVHYIPVVDEYGYL